MLKKYGLIICKQCRQGVIASHLRNHIIQHGYPGVKEEDILKEVADCNLQLCDGIKDEVLIANFKDLWEVHQPIPYLEVFDGLQCLQCGHCCKRRSSIRSHYSAYHKGVSVGDGAPKSRSVKVQSLFYHVVQNFKYFRVDGKYIFFWA